MFRVVVVRILIVGVIRIDDVASNIENNTQMNVNIYPNPAHNQLTISAEQLTIKNIEICDITGKQTNVVCHSEQSEESISIDVSNLNPGTYFITIKADKVYRGKFVKQ